MWGARNRTLLREQIQTCLNNGQRPISIAKTMNCVNNPNNQITFVVMIK
jgi:hypothetical protein